MQCENNGGYLATITNMNVSLYSSVLKTIGLSTCFLLIEVKV